MIIRGFILYEGPSAIGDGDVVCIATLESANTKTGDMVQIWILPKDRDPLDALHEGYNDSACGQCPLQGTWDNDREQMVNRVCYVNIGQAPKQVWHSYQAGNYVRYEHKQHSFYLRSREIRIGAYGDPAALPTSIVKMLANVGTGWSGYSHQLFWIDQKRAKALARWLMCSCHTKAQDLEAKRRGWRTFTAISEGQKPPKGSIECPNQTHGVQCIDCQLCQGTSKNAKSVFIPSHGMVGMNLSKVQELQGAAL